MSLQPPSDHSGTAQSLEPVTGKVIYIVGSRRLQNEAIASCLERETGHPCFVHEVLGNVPLDQANDNGLQGLVLLDCEGKDEKNVLAELRPYLSQKQAENHIALFNITRDSGIEKRCITEGVRGFFYAEDHLEILVKGVQAILDGDWWLSRGVMIKYILEGTDEDKYATQGSEGLTSRQIQILAQVAVGASNDEIAERLNISSHTVKTHLYNIFKKIRVTNRLQAALWAAKHL